MVAVSRDQRTSHRERTSAGLKEMCSGKGRGFAILSMRNLEQIGFYKDGKCLTRKHMVLNCVLE